MKKCSDCKIEKPLEYFYKNVRSNDGLCNRCKPCSKIYASSKVSKLSRKKRTETNRERINAYQRAYAKANRDKMSKYQKAYADKNRDKIRELNRKSYNQEKNRHKNNARAAARRAYKRKASLSGYRLEIDEIYKNCPKGYHVDHIMPLRGKNFCGLHVPWNLQYLPAIENLKKGNKVIL